MVIGAPRHGFWVRRSYILKLSAVVVSDGLGFLSDSHLACQEERFGILAFPTKLKWTKVLVPRSCVFRGMWIPIPGRC